MKIGISPEAADQRDVSAMTMKESRQFMRGISAVAQNDEFSARKPVNQHGNQLSGQLSRRRKMLKIGKSRAK
ncbi:MAG: hypothetical protein HZA50_07265 [Planctomycetes bacterium]|nr:hypothetical protein [Planctomycetota bacterium]